MITELYTGCIFDLNQFNAYDKISVMSRLTRRDGKTKDRRIKVRLLTNHYPMLGPQPTLIGGYIRGSILWDEFETKYSLDIQSEIKAPLVETLALHATTRPTILLCAERWKGNAKFQCHRRLLAERCTYYQPSLQIVHL